MCTIGKREGRRRIRRGTTESSRSLVREDTGGSLCSTHHSKEANNPASAGSVDLILNHRAMRMGPGARAGTRVVQTPSVKAVVCDVVIPFRDSCREDNFGRDRGRVFPLP